MAAERSPRKEVVRLRAVDGRSWFYRGFCSLSFFLLSSFCMAVVAVLNRSYSFYVSRRYFGFSAAIAYFVDGIMLSI